MKPYKFVTLALTDYNTASSKEHIMLSTIHTVIDRAMQYGTDGDCYNCGGTNGQHRNACIVKDLVEMMIEINELG